MKNSCKNQNWLLQPLLHPRTEGYEKNIEKNNTINNGNKRFTTCPTMTNLKNISLITDVKFLRNLMNPFAL